ncbi:SSM4 protein [Encephalitozoon intestinalis ATCC 50506]|uniref:RING-type E3 ubiquitin transferase n=1 Tax=Encephalitozoon intestinalis (strain ATCC 50506) TaxID=876142 RepID=E0S7K4_ENCIT|nr:SSM4 protein [Encephalitozoon intestinalis ATCC 50506]ADM11683.1 SSM4 protein [Encephalitozoon intestinalis ATCC 50506]UTX45420.1 vacuolar membrane proton pump [Encephalitozoon intestinalis]
MSEEKRNCKICHTGDVRGDELCSPCRCSGTIKYIHKECLMSWMECSKIKRCDICHYEYKFRDIYKPDTPQVLPLSVLIKGVAGIGQRVGTVLAWCILQMVKWIVVFYFNGYFFMVSTGLYDSNARAELGDILVWIAVGIPFAWLAQVNRCLFNQIRERFGEDIRRRRMTMNPRAILESLEREPREEGSREDEGGRIDENLSSDSNVSVSREISETTGVERTNFRRLSDPMNNFLFKPIISGAIGMTLPVSFIPLMYAMGRYISVPKIYGPFNEFLSAMNLEGLYTRLVGFGMVFWAIMSLAEDVRKRFCISKIKYVCIFMKIYFIIMLNIFFMNLTFGLVLHYMFGNILNKGVYVLHLSSEHSVVLKGGVSLVFHMSIGYTFSIVIRNVFLRFKRCFRPGVLHFVPDDDDSRMDELYEASKIGISRIFLRVITYLVAFSLFYGIGLTMMRWACGEIEIRFSIRSFLKLSLTYKTFTMLLYSNRILCDYVVKGLNRVVRLEARMLGMENFLYNARAVGCDKRMLMWCVNRNKIFRRQHIRAREQRRPTEREICRYFNSRLSSDFAIFYVPRQFALRCGLISLSVILSFYCIYTGYVFIAKHIVRGINIDAYIRDSGDILFYLALAFLFRISWIVIHVTTSIVKEEKGFLQTIGELCKHGVVNVYINTVYPLFGSLMVIVLSNDGTNITGVRPLRLFLFFFSSTSIVETILSSSPENYTFRALVRELCKVNAFISVLFGIWYMYNAVTLLLGLSNTEFIVLGVVVGYIIFVSKKVGQSIQSDKDFYKRLMDENYLVERRVVNFDEE